MGPRGDALLTIRGWIGSKDVGAVLIRSRLGPLRPAGSDDLAFRRRRSSARQCPYRAGRSPDWVKVKNPEHSAIQRVKEAFS